VTVKGSTGGAVTYYGKTTGISVTANQSRAANVTLSAFAPTSVAPGVSQTVTAEVSVSWSPVTTATGYQVQWADNPGFTGASSKTVTGGTSTTVGPVQDVGTHFVRVRATNADVTNGAWSNSGTWDVLPDQSSTTPGDSDADAGDLGFSPSAVGLTELNILPSSDEDWFKVAACIGDTIAAAVSTSGFTPASTLNPQVSAYHSSDLTTPYVSNGVGFEVEVQKTGDNFVVVTGNSGSVGAYNLGIAVRPGAANTGTDCGNEPPSRILFDTPGQTVAVGATVTYTATPYNSNNEAMVGLAQSWMSANPAIATVDNAGVVTGVLHGQATQTVTIGGLTRGVTTTVISSPSSTPINVFGLDPQATSDGLQGIVWTSGWAASPNDAWVVGNTGSGIARFDGANWTVGASPIDTVFYGVWGAAADDIRAVGNGGAIVHFNGTDWQTETSPATDDLFGVWGSRPGNVYAVGGMYPGVGRMLRYNGTQWMDITGDLPTTDKTFLGVWGTSSQDVFAVGEDKLLLHHDGTSWTQMTTPGTVGDTVDFNDVWGTASDNVYIAGDFGTVLHYDGASWTAVAGLPDNRHFVRMWGPSDQEVYALGSNSTVAYFDGSVWSVLMNGGTGYGSVRDMWFPTPDDIAVTFGASVLRGYRGASVIAQPVALGSAGEQVQATAEARDASNAVIPDVSFSYFSDDEGVFTVDGSGLVTAVAEGSANLIVTAAGGAADTVAVTAAFDPTQLAFTDPSAPVDFNTPFTAVVEARTASNTVATNFNGDITVALGTDAGGTVLHAGGRNDIETPILELVDPTTPALGALLATPSLQYDALTYDPVRGKVYAEGYDWNSPDQFFLEIDPVTGVETNLTPGGAFPWMKGLAVLLDGTVLGVGSSQPTLYEIDPTNGAILATNAISNTAGNSGFNGLATDPTDGTLYAVYTADRVNARSSRELAIIDPTGPSLTSVAALSEDGVSGIGFLGDGTLIAITGAGAPNPQRLWTVDKSTGTMTVRSGLRLNQGGAAIAVLPTAFTGTFTATAVNGVATFNNLVLSTPGDGFTLDASAVFNTTPIAGTSGPIQVQGGTYAPWPAGLAFQMPPATSDRLANFTVDVAVVDVFGTVVDTATTPVNLSFSTNPGENVLWGWDISNTDVEFIDPVTPELLAIGAPDVVTHTGAPLGMTYDPITDQVFLSYCSNEIHTLDPMSLVSSLVGTGTACLRGLAVNPLNGDLLGIDVTSGDLYTVDRATAAMVSLGGPTLGATRALAADPTVPGVFYTIQAPFSNAVRNLVAIDMTGGAPVPSTIGQLTEDGVAYLTFLSDGTLLAVTGKSAPSRNVLWTVDKTTAAMTRFLGLPNVDGNVLTNLPARLLGAGTVNASGGVASYNLAIDAPASGYRLSASDGSGLLGTVQSGTFDILPGTFSPGPTVGVNLKPQGPTVLVGNDVELRADAYDANKDPVPIIGWQSLNPAVADVTGSGTQSELVTAFADGQVVIGAEATDGFMGYGLVNANATGQVAADGFAQVPSAAGIVGYYVDVWGTEPTNLFAVTNAGEIAVYDGASWTDTGFSGPSSLWGIWGTSGSDIWAVGSAGSAYHFDGSNWTSTNTGVSVDLWGVWGSAPNDVWAVGSTGTIVHWDGSAWGAPFASGTTETLEEVWGTSASDVFAVGSLGTILHFDGTSWSAPFTTGTTETLYGIWGTSPTNIFVSGSTGALLHYTGNPTWSVSATGTGTYWDMYGTGADDVYAVSTNGEVAWYNGSNWALVPSTVSRPGFAATWASATGSVWAMGSSGKIFRGIRGATPIVLGDATALPSATSVGSGLIFARQVTLPSDMYLSSIGEITQTAGNQAAIGLYDDNGGQPGNLVVGSSVFTTVVGTQEYAVSGVVPAGTYWISFSYDASTSVGYGTTFDQSYVSATLASPGTPSTFPTAGLTPFTEAALNHFIRGWEIPSGGAAPSTLITISTVDGISRVNADPAAVAPRR
jgi:hypothetical protein